MTTNATALIVLLTLTLSVSPGIAEHYYVSNSGDDSRSGTNPQEAWASLAKVNRFDFAPGDVVHFQAGGVWRGQLIPRSGSAAGAVTYTSYGAGPKPLLLGSVAKGKLDDWKQAAPNVWQTGPFPVDVGNIVFNNGEACGVKVWEETDLDEQNKFCFDRESKMVKLYSLKNPAQLYDDIECALKRHIINEGGKHHVVYDSLHLAFGAAHGIGGGGTHHIVVRNCDLCFIGGGHQFSRKTRRGVYHVRYGNGIEFWSGAHDNLVENCRIWDIYDAGVTNQGSAKNQQYNIVYRNNVIWNCEYSFEYWNRPESSVTHDIYFENNRCFYAGRGWSDGQPYKRGQHLMFFANSARTDNFYVRKNVFHDAQRAVVSVQMDPWNGLDKLVLDKNLYYQPPDQPLAWWGRRRQAGRSFFARQFQEYRAFTGKDADSRVVTLKALTLEPPLARLHPKETTPLKAVLLYSDGARVDVTLWTSFVSSAAAVCTVEGAKTENRLHLPSPSVRGARPGRAVITGRFEGLVAKTAVTVSR